jgi:hypothetical protein
MPSIATNTSFPPLIFKLDHSQWSTLHDVLCFTDRLALLLVVKMQQFATTTPVPKHCSPPTQLGGCVMSFVLNYCGQRLV